MIGNCKMSQIVTVIVVLSVMTYRLRADFVCFKSIEYNKVKIHMVVAFIVHLGTTFSK